VQPDAPAFDVPPERTAAEELSIAAKAGAHAAFGPALLLVLAIGLLARRRAALVFLAALLPATAVMSWFAVPASVVSLVVLAGAFVMTARKLRVTPTSAAALAVFVGAALALPAARLDLAIAGTVAWWATIALAIGLARIASKSQLARHAVGIATVFVALV
jgi:hypothetical protein